MPSDQLTALNANARTHDRRGNLLSNVQAGETLLYSWDDESQLTSVRVDPPSSLAVQSWRIDFVYDGLRRLRRMVQFTWNGSAWTSQGEVRYLYDEMLMVQERNAGNAPQVQYSRGVDLSGTIHGAGGIGGLLMRSHGLSGTNWSSHNAYHSDANGNVTALVNSSGLLVASYKYNPYGALISSSGALASANRMRFSSKPAILSATGAWGFYYYGYRFYDPLNQRWLNRDPLEEAGGRNLYAYVEGSPLNLIDLYGLNGTNPGGTSGMCTKEYWEIVKWLAEEGFEEVTGLPAPSSLKGLCPTDLKKAMEAPKSAVRCTRDAASAALRRSMNLAKGRRAHHNIPWTFNQHPLVRQASKGGFNVNNGLDNGTDLSETFHKGFPDWHRAYNEAVKSDLDSLWRPNMSPEEAAAVLKAMSERLREMLKQCDN